MPPQHGVFLMFHSFQEQRDPECAGTISLLGVYVDLSVQFTLVPTIAGSGPSWCVPDRTGQREGGRSMAALSMNRVGLMTRCLDGSQGPFDQRLLIDVSKMEGNGLRIAMKSLFDAHRAPHLLG